MKKSQKRSNSTVPQILHAERNHFLTSDLKVDPKKMIKETIFEKLDLFSDNENIKCKYYTNQQFKENSSDKHKNQMTVLYINMLSLPCHTDEFTELLRFIKTNFIGIMKSRLTAKKDPMNKMYISSHNIKHTPTKLDKGGNLLYISKDLNYKKWNNRKLYQDKKSRICFYRAFIVI